MKQFIVELVKVKQFVVEANDIHEAENIAIELDGDKEEDIVWVRKHYDKINVEEA